MTNAKRIRAGIIGAGFISNYHIPGLLQAGAEIVMVSSLVAEEAERQSARYGIPHRSTDYRDLLARPDIDVAVILTPDATHREIVVAAAQAGKAILLQKPMARTSDECREIIEAADKAKVFLYVSFMHRYFPEVQAVRDLLAKDALGHPLSIRQRNATAGANWAPWFYQKENVGGGVVMQLGVHGIDLLRYLFGEIVAVRATTTLMKKERILKDGTVVKPTNEDLALATYRFASGAMASHEMVYNEVAGTDRFRLEIYGEKGTAWLRTERGALTYWAPSYLGTDGWFVPSLPDEDLGLRQHRHFLQMLTGEAPKDASDRDGLASILVAEAIYRSAESERWEEVIPHA
jgi:UDP-N-acetyl-2-amino-2-deoxyglucuronate dehydrogenase